VHPETREVLETYVHELPLQLELIPARNFRTDTAAIKNTIDEQTAAVLLQTPNFAGCVEPMSEIADAVHEAGGLLIASIDPVSVGLMKTPGDQGADIVVGEGQALGVPMSYGGPALGLMACRQKFLRKLPGRVVGATRDRSGRRAFCLTLQTREQHIRRERATSNICTNQGLLAIRAVIYLSAVGPAGLKQVASLCLNKTQYAASQIGKLPGFEVVSPQPFFKEFVVRTKKNVNELLQAMASRGLFVGPALEKWDSEHQDCFLVAVTEKRTKSEIDQLVSAMKDVT
jgi:glycine dehydrogenase subunit 1